MPCAYMTAYFALVIRGGLKSRHSVLIHSGAGAVGLASIRICLARGCEVCPCLHTPCTPEHLLPVPSKFQRWTAVPLVLPCHCQGQDAGYPLPACGAPHGVLAPLQVFTTCGSEKKREFLKETFPLLDDEHIGDSHSTSFEALVMKKVSARLWSLAVHEPEISAARACCAFKSGNRQCPCQALVEHDSLTAAAYHMPRARSLG